VHPPGPEQHLHHPHKQADTDDHHHDCEQSTPRPGKRDVAEPGRGQRRDREIQRTEIVPDRRVVPMHHGYLKNGGTLEKAAAMANHASTRTTQLYDRRRDELSLDEVERIVI
jgi:hypothetical protein